MLIVGEGKCQFDKLIFFDHNNDLRQTRFFWPYQRRNRLSPFSLSDCCFRLSRILWITPIN